MGVPQVCLAAISPGPGGLSFSDELPRYLAPELTVRSTPAHAPLNCVALGMTARSSERGDVTTAMSSRIRSPLSPTPLPTRPYY